MVAEKQNTVDRLADRIMDSLEKRQGAKVIPYDLNAENLVVFDFTGENPELESLDVSDTPAFTRYIFQKLKQGNARVGVGRYNENRTIYNKSPVFDSSPDAPGQRRTLHVGIDLWVAAQTPVLAALDGRVHSFQDNRAFGDYGPTVILEHLLGDLRLYTLYGHLSRNSLKLLYKNKEVKAGQKIGRVGDIHENGSWPPHVHFEIITDLLGKEGDFPGVCSLDQQKRYLRLCPDPNLLLKINALE